MYGSQTGVVSGGFSISPKTLVALPDGETAQTSLPRGSGPAPGVVTAPSSFNCEKRVMKKDAMVL